MEVLKQAQYQPMPVEQQVMIIYAVTNGFIDDVPSRAACASGSSGFHEFMAAQFPQVGERIRAEKALSKEIEADLKRAHRGVQEAARQGRADVHGCEPLTYSDPT